MKVYKFRVLTDEQEDFIRDLELTEDHSFYDFHLAILQTTSLAGSELSSFFMCDKNWEKQAEIMLIDMDGPEGGSQKNGIMSQYVMSESYIGDFITQPKQRFLYEYDFLNLKTFFIELVQEKYAEEGVRYPHCSLRKGLLKNSQDNSLDTDLGEDFDESALLKDFNNLLHHTLENDEDDI
ncbi:MAG: hypothetical protein C0593_05380 [Marinilabiliales bacterium]|nr:MAG: hypothetical protein C0593_05380 [Marinilabiliales bacterium]